MKGAKAVTSFITSLLKFLKGVQDFQGNLKSLRRIQTQSLFSRPVLGLPYAMTVDQGGEQMVSFELYVSFLVMETQFFKFSCVSLL